MKQFVATWTDLAIVLLSEVRGGQNSERERQISYVITYMWNLKYNTKELIYETNTDTQT